jgi:hypothetical protein
VVTALGYGTRGLSVGQRVFGLTDWYRDGTLAEYATVEARNLTPLPGDVGQGRMTPNVPFSPSRLSNRRMSVALFTARGANVSP